MDQLEYAGIVGTTKGNLPRDVYVKNENDLKLFLYKDIKLHDKIKLEHIDKFEVKKEYYRNLEIETKNKLEREAIERQKDSIKQDIIYKQRKRGIEKLAIQELIDEGVIFPEANKRPPIPRDTVDAVWNRDGGKCVYCGSTENIHLDHIIPFSKGGATCIENLQLLCEKCNKSKSNKIG